jgi:2,3-bisphosphoglycerate-independent phosphoglycerate mutase
VDLELAKRLSAPNESKILFCVLSGLGGLHRHETLRSELERAEIPHLDRLATRSEVGLSLPIAAGITPGGVTGSLALLGYDPLRFSALDALPSLRDTWGLNAAVIAEPETSLARAATAAGATTIALTRGPDGPALPDAIAALQQHWPEFDVFFLGYAKPGAAGAAGDFELKCRTLHEFDTHVPELLALNADVLVISGDCSLPALHGRPTWHPVPFLLHSEICREGNAENFNEQTCLKGSLGVFPAMDVMPLTMAHAQRLQPFGG